MPALLATFPTKSPAQLGQDLGADVAYQTGSIGSEIMTA